MERQVLLQMLMPLAVIKMPLWFQAVIPVQNGKSFI
jgi:hypothetical protein